MSESISVNHPCVTRELRFTKDRMPEPHQIVIVSGGLACWTGSVWLSKTGDDNCRVIRWDVKWWIPLIHDEDIPWLL